MKIKPRYKNLIFSEIKQLCSGAKIFAFGSRVKGRSSDYSDLDIVIKGENKIPLDILAKVKEMLSETDIPFKIDVSDYYRLSDSFKKIVDKEAIEIR